MGRSRAPNPVTITTRREQIMKNAWTTTALLGFVFALAACGGDGTGEAPEVVMDAPEIAPPAELRVHEPAGPSGYHFAGLPNGWIQASRTGDRVMLTPSSGEDAWIVAAVEPDILGRELERAVATQLADVERSEGGEHLGTGTVDTANLGTAAWSLARFAEDEEVRDELVLFVSHPSEYASISLRYIYPASDDPSSRLIQLVAVANTIAPGV